MHNKTAKYGLLILLVLSVGLYIVNRLVDFELVMGRHHYFLLVTTVIAILTIVIFYFRQYRVTYFIGLTFVLISFLINASFSVDLYNSHARLKEMEKIYAIADCDEAENVFKSDLAKNKLRYFTFGIAEDKESVTLLQDKYHLKVIYMGCIVRGQLLCYNEKVEQHLHMRTE